MADERRGTAITRRAALGTMAVAGTGYAIWPIRPRHSADIPSGRVEVSYWEKWTGSEGQALQRMVNRFNESQNDVWVTRTPVSDIITKSLVAIAGGDPPDVVGLFDFSVPQFAETRAIWSLHELDPTYEPPDYVPAVRSLITHDDRLWAGISTCHSMALYYDRARFAEADLDPDNPPSTLEELDRACDALVEKDAQGLLLRAGLMPSIPDWWPYIWPAMYGGSLFDAKTNTATLLDDANVAAFEWIAGIPSRYGESAVRAFSTGYGRSYLSPQDPFMRGRVGMVVQGPWLANFIRQFAPDFDYGCGPLPISTGHLAPGTLAGHLEADVLMLPRGSRAPHAALEFVRFMQRPDVLEELARAHCKGTPLATASAGFTTDHPNPYVGIHDAVTRSPRVNISPRTRVWSQYSQLLASAFQAIWGGADVRNELSAVQTRVQRLLDTAALRKSQRSGS